MHVTILVTPLARGAFFADVERVAREELRLHNGATGVVRREHPTLLLLDADVPDEAVSVLPRLACVQAVFRVQDEAWTPLALDPAWTVPEVLVDGAKYRGKTNERMTRLALGLARAAAKREVELVLDPVAGRGTTLLEAVRHGLEAWGIEQDPSALDDLRRHVKGTAKVHRIKHKEQAGWVGPKNTDKVGRYLQYDLGGSRLKLITGDSRDLPTLVGPKRRFDAIVGDLPYGVQHTGDGSRSPEGFLREAIPVWASALAEGGALVLVFNRLQPTRSVMEAIVREAGLHVVETDVAHRMSASIWRDVVVATRR